MYALFSEKNVRFIFLSAFDKTVPWNQPKKILHGIDGVILGGSAELHLSERVDYLYRNLHDEMMDNMRFFIHYILKNDFPTLGICFGHQLLGYMLGSVVRYDPLQAKTGTFLVSILKEAYSDPLFTGIRSNFLAQYGHLDSLCQVPSDVMLLARGKQCRYSCFRYKDHIYGTQFHPELTDKDMKGRLRFSKEYVKNSEEETLQYICSSKQAELLLKNFVEYIAETLSD